MSKRQDVIDQIVKWIEDIHNTENDLYRYIHRGDQWRYEKIGKKRVYSDDNEYSAGLSCSKCHAITDICVKKGVDVRAIMNDVECHECGIKFVIKDKS